MASYQFYLASSLEKVFPQRRPRPMDGAEVLPVFRGTKGSVQLVYWKDALAEGPEAGDFTISVEGGPCACTLRKCELIPSDFPCYPDADEDYATREPGLFPDLLRPMEKPVVRVLHRQYRTVWITWKVPEDAPAGEYPVRVRVSANSNQGEVSFENRFTIQVPRAALPEQKLLHTEWFHCDCLAQYYGTQAFTEKHWEIIENFICFASQECGINMILTPIFTPPLDTAPDGERMTMQLIGIRVDKGVYTFDFSRLERWAKICRNAGIRALEISHLFTQWGAIATPKVVAVVDGETKKIAGNHVPGNSPEYRKLMEALIPAMRKKLEELGYDRNHVYFHISDEPSLEQLESYQAARNQVIDLLEGCPMMDALSNLEFYKKGLIDRPVVAIDHIEPFVEAKAPNLWGYYCCGQNKLVPNRFFAMESPRNRIMGVLMYLYGLQGFLQWGYNFYNCQLSLHPIDPYQVTHAEYAFPSGDSFLVYPGPDGNPLASLRAEVQMEGLVDLRSLELLEALVGRERTLEIILQDVPGHSMSFKAYPKDGAYLLELRRRVVSAIEANYRT